MIIEGLIVSNSLILSIASILWMIWFQESAKFTFIRLRNAFLATMLGTLVVAIVYTGDLSLSFGFLAVLLAFAVQKLEVKERFKQEPCALAFMNMFLFVVNSLTLGVYSETHPKVSIAVIMGLMVWLVAITWLINMVTGRKKLFPIYVFEDGLMAIFCLVPTIGIPLSLIV